MITYLVGREEAEVEGWVGDDVSLGTLCGAGHHLVSQPGQGWLPGHSRCGGGSTCTDQYRAFHIASRL